MASNDRNNRPGHPREGADSSRGTGSILPGSLASLETTLPPTPLKQLLAADGASVYVYSLDSDLVDTVQEAGGEQYPVHSVSDWTKLLSVIDRGLCHIVLLDADAMDEDLEKRIVDLRGLEPALVILLAAPRDTAQKLIGLLSDRSIHRLLIKPAATGITRLLLESAVGRYLQLRERQHETLEEQIDNLRHRPAAQPPTGWPSWVLATALVSLLLAAVVVGGVTRFDLFGSSPPPETAAGGDAPSPAADESITTEAVVSEPVAEPPAIDAPPAGVPDNPFAAELAAAALALVEGRVAEPEGDSALDLYADILRADPDEAEAAAQLGAIIDQLYASAEAALLDGRLDDAAATIAHIGRVRPATGRLAFIEAQLTRARELEAAATAAPAVPEPAAAVLPPSEFESLLTLAESRMERGRLVVPAGDSALAYLDRAAALEPDDQRLLDLRAALAARVAGQARLVLDDGDIDRAAQLTDAAFTLGADSELLALLELDLVNARAIAQQRARQQILDLGLERLRAGDVLLPEGDSALFYLSRLRREQADFPGLQGPWTQLVQDVAEQARNAVQANDWAAAETLIAALRQASVDPALVDELQSNLVYERRQIQFLSSPVPMGALELVSSVVPVYPSIAQRMSVEGWVDLRFIVDSNGVPRDITVVAAQPPQRFDESAVDAVSQYRFVPFELDGIRYDRLVTLRIRFTLE